MKRDVLADLRAELRTGSRARLSFTRRAFRALPTLEQPKILDVGCGVGVPTMELAKLSDGEIVALDIDQAVLDELSSRTERAGMSERVTVVRRSMLDMDFADESFDIVWSEGAAYVIGFSAALRDWRRLIRPGGFLVIHEMVWLKPDPPKALASQWLGRYPWLRTVSQQVEEIQPHGYELIECLPVPAETWWIDYYGPLEKRIHDLRAESPADQGTRRVIAEQEEEIALFKSSYDWIGSCFFIMRRNSLY